MSDPHDLERFVTAQHRAYEDVVAELTAGHKSSHWMWFVFPQISGLGSSAMARRYAVASLAEARAYLAHPLLGARLVECTSLVIDIEGRSITEILGTPDDLKFRSSMTLFDAASDTATWFREALDKYYGGNPCARTLDKLSARTSP